MGCLKKGNPLKDARLKRGFKGPTNAINKLNDSMKLEEVLNQELYIWFISKRESEGKKSF